MVGSYKKIPQLCRLRVFNPILTGFSPHYMLREDGEHISMLGGPHLCKALMCFRYVCLRAWVPPQINAFCTKTTPCTEEGQRVVEFHNSYD